MDLKNILAFESISYYLPKNITFAPKISELYVSR